MNRVFIATSLDGYIADVEGRVDFLDTFPMPDGDQMGYDLLMNAIDAILMGRKSFETVLGFGIDWPYTKPVFVWSETLQSVPEGLASKVVLVRGTARDVRSAIREKGFEHLYVDGGKTIQSFLAEDLIDHMTITTIPVLLGGGVSLFGSIDHMLAFRCVESKVYENGVVQNEFERRRQVM